MATTKRKKAASKASVKSSRKNPAKKKSIKKTAVKKSTPARKSEEKAARKTAPRKKAATLPKKTARKKAPVKKSSNNSSEGSRKRKASRQPTPRVEAETTQQPSNPTTDMDPMRATDQRAFDKFTAKSDPHQHLQLSNKPKGGVKPSGKKPLWNR